jgi:hypothetical protein
MGVIQDACNYDNLKNDMVISNNFSYIISPMFCLVKGLEFVCKVLKTQHQNPEFGHTLRVRFKRNQTKKYISIQWEVKLRKPSIFVIN